jgi:hypothetical protein
MIMMMKMMMTIHPSRTGRGRLVEYGIVEGNKNL